MHNRVNERNFKNHNADHLEPLICAKIHLPFQNYNSWQIDKGREREREREFYLKTSTIHWYPRDYLIIIILFFGAQMEKKSLKKVKNPGSYLNLARKVKCK